MTNLFSFPSYVESPFVIVDINGVKFGSPNVTEKGRTTSFSAPNFLTGMEVVKINGSVNTYTINMLYKITQYDDPNYLENVFASVGPGGIIKISYGDYATPSYSFKDEEVILTNVTSSTSFDSSTITYTLSCTSTCLPSLSAVYRFPARLAKPSKILMELFTSSIYGLQETFPGMTKETLYKYIPTNDKSVKIESFSGSILSYLNFLTECMISESSGEDSNGLSNSKYFMTISDDGEGMQFKVSEIVSGTSPVSSDNSPTSSSSGAYSGVYEIDIGYPGNNFVTSFSTNVNNSYSFLYKYLNDVKASNYVYTINDKGEMETVSSPGITTSSTLNYTKASTKSWWSQVTKFPINATITIKGLVVPTLLMNYVKLNVVFYGHKHIATGVYTIIKQVDNISSNGYTTTLSLIRIDGDV